MFEFSDQTWLPRVVRREMTIYLDFLAAFMGRYVAASELVAQALELAELDTVVDLCSGASRTAVNVRDRVEVQLGRSVTIHLTDMHPVVADEAELGERVIRECRSVDARSVPEDLVGLRTLYTSFHHFRGVSAQAVLNDAMTQGQPIAIFEHADRGLWVKLKLVLTTPVLVTMSLVYRDRVPLSALILNILFPVVPLCLAWDGIVSVGRTYSIDQMRRVIDSSGGSRYDWWVGRTGPMGKRGKGPLYYLFGAPSQSDVGVVVETRGSLPHINIGADRS